MKVYKITFWKTIKPSIIIILPIFFFIGFMAILMLGLHYRDGQIPIFLVALTIFWVLILSVPNLILHVNYIKEDRKKELSIDFFNKKVTLSHNGNRKVFFFNDIEKVVKFSVRSQKSKGFNTTAAWRYFYYYKIELKDGNSIFLTRCLIQNIEKLMPDIFCEYSHQRFPIVKNY